jgi:hypothetical protein
LANFKFIPSLRAIGKMDQKVVTLYLAQKGVSAVEIHTDLVAKLGPDR